MDRPSEHLTKLHITAALEQRATRIAVLIVESICHGVDLIDEQPQAVNEALIEYFEKKVRERSPHRAIRQSLLDYSKEALVEARSREHRLYCAITGEPEEPSDVG
jgi:hypothetical protein